MFETKKAALAVVHSLSKLSKMPCPGYGLPAAECPVGKKLRPVKGSTCNDCYGLKGRYVFPNVVEAQYKRMETLLDIRWVPAMVHLLKPLPHFRWHDCGDVLGQWHLNKIFQVCRATPNTKHWMPSREYKLIKDNLDQIPKNLVIRLSAAMIDGAPPTGFYNTSSVHHLKEAIGTACPAPQNAGECGDCRMCWDKRRRNISYKRH